MIGEDGLCNQLLQSVKRQVSEDEANYEPANMFIRLIKVALKPSAKREVDGTITCSGTTAGLTVHVHGTGVTGYLKGNPSSISFGTVQVGYQKSAQITLTNNVSHEVGIHRLYVYGTGWSYSGLSAPIYLRPGQSYTFTAIFRPKSAGTIGGKISVVSSAPNWNVVVALWGTGGSTGNLSLGASTLNFGNVSVGTSKSVGGSLAASGKSVTVSSATTSSSEFTLTGLRFPFTIPAGQHVSFSAKFTPQSSGTASAERPKWCFGSKRCTIHGARVPSASESQHVAKSR